MTSLSHPRRAPSRGDRVRSAGRGGGKLPQPARVYLGIVVQEDHPCSIGGLNPPVVSFAVTEIPVEGDDPDAVYVPGPEIFHRSVGRPVVHEDRFKVAKGRGEARVQALFEKRTPVPVENDDRKKDGRGNEQGFRSNRGSATRGGSPVLLSARAGATSDDNVFAFPLG